MSMNKQEELIAAIKSKKGLETLDDDFVKQKVEKIFGSDNRIKKKFEASKDFAQFSRSREYESLLKSIRKELRAVYGVFQQGDREALLSRLKTADANREQVLNDILETHTSTRERMPYYAEIYGELAKRIPKPKRILDLGCGMNPLSHHYFQDVGWNPEIIASDISEQDMRFLTECFKVMKIKGKAVRLDLTAEYERLQEFPADVILMLKLLDSLEEAKRHISYKIFSNLRADWIVVSFPTKSLGGKRNISTAGRTWFERLLTRKELKWETFNVPNELFYVIRKVK